MSFFRSRQSYRRRILTGTLLTIVGVTIAISCRQPQIVQLQILQTTDLHAFIENSDELPDGGGGWLRIATLINRQRRESGADHTLLIDCGDTCQGTLAAAVSQGDIAVRLLRHLRYDVWVPGNHELDFGVERCRQIWRDVGEPTLCGNLTLSGNDHSNQPQPGWRLFHRAGARIAVIGATASYFDQWFWGNAYRGYQVETAIDFLDRVIPEVHRQQPDMIVLAIHQGWLPEDPREVNEVATIAERFPEIDLILGGHTHWSHAGRQIANRTWYVQSGLHADALAVIHATLDVSTNKVMRISSELLTAGPDIPLDTDSFHVVRADLEKAAAVGREVVGQLTTPVTSRGQPGIDCASSELISAAIADATQAEVVVHGRLSRHDLASGNVTQDGIFAVVPYENSVGILQLSPQHLTEVINEQWQNRKSYVSCGLWGVFADLDANGHVTRLTMPDNRPLPAQLRVAFNSYTLAGGGGRFPVLHRLAQSRDCAATDTMLKTRQLLATFIQKNSPLHFKVQRWLRPTPTPAINGANTTQE